MVPHSIGPPFNWSPIQLVSHSTGLPFNWSSHSIGLPFNWSSHSTGLLFNWSSHSTSPTNSIVPQIQDKLLECTIILWGHFLATSEALEFIVVYCGPAAGHFRFGSKRPVKVYSNCKVQVSGLFVKAYQGPPNAISNSVKCLLD